MREPHTFSIILYIGMLSPSCVLGNFLYKNYLELQKFDIYCPEDVYSGYTFSSLRWHPFLINVLRDINVLRKFYSTLSDIKKEPFLSETSIVILCPFFFRALDDFDKLYNGVHSLFPSASLRIFLSLAPQEEEIDAQCAFSNLFLGSPVEHIQRWMREEAYGLPLYDSLIHTLQDRYGDHSLYVHVHDRSRPENFDLVQTFLKFCKKDIKLNQRVIGQANYDFLSLPREFLLFSRLANSFRKEIYPQPGLLPWSVQAQAFMDDSTTLSFFTPEQRATLRQYYASSNRKTASLLERQELFSEPPTDKKLKAFVPLSPGSAYSIAQHFTSDFAQNLLRVFNLECKTYHTIEEIYCHKALQSVVAHKSPSIPIVSVLTLTYNHAAYIAQLIESILLQKIKFQLQLIIADDASTDGTQEIILSYAKKYSQIIPVFQAKRYAGHGRNLQALFSLARTPYVALCDGDDYFSDPFKLQTQVDFMEAHPECGLCFHPVKVIYEDGSGRERLYPPLEEMPRGVREFYYLSDLLRVNFIQTNSVMYRWRFTQGLPDWFVPDLVPGDWYWHLLHAETGKIGFINKVMSVYRRHKASLFYASEISPKANRLKHGLSELRSYDVINRHFKGRYAKLLHPLANNVLADFLEEYLETGDNTLLRTACERFPELGRAFLAQVNIVRVPRAHA